MTQPVALITGASSGIGRELARVFARKGHDLIVTARREDRLLELAEELSPYAQVNVVTADLTKAKGPQQLYRTVRDLGRDVDVLVNNAGTAHTGMFRNITKTDNSDMVKLNIRALTELTAHFVDGMVERGRGKILNVASIAGFQPVPGMAVYSASKAFVLAFSESLSEELRDTGVTVTALCPGLTKTALVNDIKLDGLAEGMTVPEFLMASPRDVARQGYKACKNGDVLCVPGMMNQAIIGWTQLQPRWVNRLVSGIAARTTLGG